MASTDKRRATQADRDRAGRRVRAVEPDEVDLDEDIDDEVDEDIDDEVDEDIEVDPDEIADDAADSDGDTVDDEDGDAADDDDEPATAPARRTASDERRQARLAKRRRGIAHRLYTGDIQYDFIKRRRRWYLISAVMILVALSALLVRGLNLSIEFRGGADFQAPVRVTSETVPQVRDAVLRTGLPRLDDIQVVTTGAESVRVQTRTLSVDEVTRVRNAIAEQVNTTPDRVTYNLIGASWGQQITQQALIALVVFLVLVMLMIGLYFRDWTMSVVAIVALIHDLILTIGIYALAGFTVTPATVIGVLTILGYSLYDTVVVFDKVRENTRGVLQSSETFSQAANRAINQVLVRSINTTIIGVLPVAALLFAGSFVLGTGPLRDLGLALFVGMIVGAYSSIFIATPMVAQFVEHNPEQREHRLKLERRRLKQGKGRPAAPDVVVADDASDEVDADDDQGADLVGTDGRDLADAAADTGSDAGSAARPQPSRRTRRERRR